MEQYSHQEIEKKWQKYWEENPKINAANDASQKPKKYILDMWPYPSGDGLHVGHVESYTATDIMSRYYRMNGFNVLHSQGWDAFGLPAENYAIKTGVHPSETTAKAIATFKKQMNSMGFSYDWSREQNSSNPEYYKWTQWFFLFLYKNGLAYKKKAKVNWCPKCQTVLANEQAEGGICDRCQTEVVQKDLEQWFFKITDFIEQNKNTTGLIEGLEKLDWPESIKAAQKNWIGKSIGTEFDFKINGSEEKLRVFTTRIDTAFGITYVVVAPEHKIVQKLRDKIENYSEVEDYLVAAKNKTDLERMEMKDKTGIELKGIKVINPFNDEEVPLFVADYVLAQYGTGAVMAVPAHDERDFEFAKKYNLPIKRVIEPCFYQLTEPGKIKEGEAFVERNAITALVKHWEKDEYIALKWKKVAWRTLITGGVENGQTPEEAARMEVLEETGYKNLKLIKEVPMVHSKFYHIPKKENRFAHFHVFYFQLENGEQNKISDKEQEIHEVEWIPADKMNNYFTAESHNYIWQKLDESGEAYVEDGVLNNSEGYNFLSSEEAREKMTAWLEETGAGKKVTNYRLRDWLVSRQRYWGAPIPIIYCEKCGEMAVPEEQLPVLLPTDVDFKPTGESPLVNSKTFHDVKCPKCGGEARRESDTMDTFVCSSWYYLRYGDPKNEKEFASKEEIEKWLPVDLYVGGAEHAVLHLLYARFFTKALHNLGYVDFDEPFLKLRNQGMILAEDGRKMSKSLGNVINPDSVVAEHGADTLRMFEMFMGPLEDAKPWQTQSIIGIKRFLEKVWNHYQFFLDNFDKLRNVSTDVQSRTKLNQTINKVTEDIENFRFNTAISSLMVYLNFVLGKKSDQIGGFNIESAYKFLKLLHPFAPHVTSELFNVIQERDKKSGNNNIMLEKWPESDQQYLKDETVTIAIQINGKMRGTIEVNSEISEEEVEALVLEDEKVKNHIAGKEIKKIIFVKGKLISIVI